MGVTWLESSEGSSKKSIEETKKTETRPSAWSNEAPVETAYLSMVLEETGTFRICTPPCSAKQTASVLKRLNEREREAWSRRFTPSCIEKIVNDPNVDADTRQFFQEIEKKNKEL